MERTREATKATAKMVAGEATETTRTHSRHINITKHIIWLPHSSMLMLRCRSHTTAHYTIEYWHDIHALEVSRWGEHGPSGPQGLHHHANPVASHKHTKHEWDESL
jgi:hypothetical protein